MDNLKKNNSENLYLSQAQTVPYTYLNFASEMDKEKMVLRILSTHKYLYVDVYKKEVTRICKNDFSRRDNACLVFKGFLVKYKGKRADARAMLCNNWKQFNFQQEGLKETLKKAKDQFGDFCDGLNAIFSTIVKVGQTRQFVNAAYDDLINNYVQPINDSSIVDLLKAYGFKFIKLLASIYNLYKEGQNNLLDYAMVCISLLDILTPGGIPSFKKESLDTLLLAGVSAMLPSQIFGILKKLHTLTGRKVLDDSSILLDFLSSVSSLLESVIGFLPDTLSVYLRKLLAIFGLSEYIYIQKAKNLMEIWEHDKKIMLNTDFRSKVKKLTEEIKALDLKKFFHRSKPLGDLASDFERLAKSVKSYEETSRTEPCCFIFEGPAGCRKSVMMNKVVASLGLSHYAHIVKCSEDGKDWYDSYNNETVFYMDDVGQMGKSQWRNLINWVSSVKLPLDCAEAKLKDTKYFNSDIILLTTNNFKDLQGFTSKDCIETPEALWRRGLVFDFSQVQGQGSNIIGTASFKYYDLKQKNFVLGFPEDFLEFLREKEVILDPVHCVQTQNDFIVWLNTIILGIKQMKQNQMNNNTLEPTDIEMIRVNNPFSAQVIKTTFKVAKDSLNSLISNFGEYANFCLEIASEYMIDALRMLQTNSALAMAGLALSTLFVGFLFKFKQSFESEGNIQTNIATKTNSELLDSFTKIDLENAHSLLPKVASQMHEISVTYQEKEEIIRASCHGLVSERLILLPYHLIADRTVQITIYKGSKEFNHRLVDHSPVEVKYINVVNDVAVVSLSEGFPTPFPKLANCFKPVNDKVIGLVFPNKILKLEGIIRQAPAQPLIYPITDYLNNEIKDPLVYKGLHYNGMCGTVLISDKGHIKGMHVAGSDDLDLGASLYWSESCRNDLFEVFSLQDKGLKIQAPISDRILENTSGIKLDTGLAMFTPKNSNFVKSPLYDLFENTRKPANLSVYGPHTVKDIAKAARTPIGYVIEDELEFAADVISQYFEDFDNLTEKEIVLGDELLARVNKKSSNGIFPIKTKEECFDYESGTMKPEFKQIYEEFEKKMATGDVSPSDIAWFETGKDELRNNEKKEPRTFRVSPVTMQVLTKKCFGNMVKKIVTDRWFNEIMIGINPFTEWKQLYAAINHGREWGGDIGKYDKNMRVQVQLMVAKVILSFYKGENQQEAKNILYNIAYSLVVVNDDTFILTHSLPSGCWLTAIFNSLVNRVYTAMWYYREMKANGQKPKWSNFHKDLADPVYGDDRLNSCKNINYAHFLNAMTMKNFFESMGMEMTDSMKGVIDTPFQPIEQITFLKRSFVYHPSLGQITCPLDLRTVYSTLSWIDGKKEDQEGVLDDKINAFQREIFLHYEKRKRDILKLRLFCEEKGIPFRELPESYLKNLYLQGIFDEQYNLEHGLLCSFKAK
jgi:hypothetical protein